MIGQLRGRHEAICAARQHPAPQMTVVFDAGQNSEDNFAYLVLATSLFGDPAAGFCEDASARLCAHPDVRRPLNLAPGLVWTAI